MKKPRLILLEGISGCGKTTLYHPVGQLSDYRDQVLMRFTPSCWVFSKLYGREPVDWSEVEIALEQTADVVVVWLRVEPREALRRQDEKQDVSEDLVAADLLFDNYFNHYTKFKTIVTVNTSHLSIEATIETIRKKLY